MLRSGLLVLILAAPMLAQNAVWVVGPASGPGIDFTDVQSAVSAAAQGDTILVNSGVYAPFVVTDKSVSLTASSGAAVTIQGFAIVQNLASTRFVTLTGITFQADGPSMPALHCDHNAGAVWLQDCDLAGYSQAPIVGVETGTAALVVDICASVVLSHCSLTGGAGAGGRPALLSSYSQVHLYASTCVGGTGGCDTSEPMHCFLPAAAVSVNGGLLSVQSSMLQGGASAPGELQCVPVFGCLCVQVLQGAPAITLVSGFPQAALYDTTLTAGPASAPCGMAGTSPTLIYSGTLAEATGPALDVTAGTPLHVSEAGSIHFAGAPGGQVVALVALSPADAWLPKLHGPLLLGGTTFVLPLGALPPSGMLSLAYAAPPLPPGFDSVEFLVQGAVSSVAGRLLANPAQVVVLAPRL